MLKRPERSLENKINHSILRVYFEILLLSDTLLVEMSRMFDDVNGGTASQERIWNRPSEMMNSFHEWFKQEFNTLYELADGSFNARGLSVMRYLDMAKAMSHHLTIHHEIEEKHIFPVLAKFIPKFSSNEGGEHVASHRDIHQGLEELDRLVAKWKESPSSYSPTEMRTCLDNFRQVLFHHLDEEVTDLRGANLKKFMTLEDVISLPM